MLPRWQKRLEDGEIVLIDGGTGTELERRGVTGDEATWSGKGMSTHERLVREIHEDYIRAGAEVIVTNTFGTTRQMLEGAGLGAQAERINRRAVEVALEARSSADRPVAVAGSISAMPPHFDRSAYPDKDAELEVYREHVDTLAGAGAEIIALEMMEETVHAPLAIRAATESGLPLWLGLSCKLHPESGEVVSFGPENVPFARLVDKLLDDAGPALVNLMHSEIDAIPEAIAILEERWDGPIGVYPESGYFVKPNWNFVDVISPEDLVEEAKGWVVAGVRLLGGCCGTGPEHIEALDRARAELDGCR